MNPSKSLLVVCYPKLILLEIFDGFFVAINITIQHATISGTLDEWQSWFLEEHKRMDAGRFYADVLQRGGDELEKKLPVSITYTKLTRGRKTVGFEITFTDTSIQELDGEHED